MNVLDTDTLTLLMHGHAQVVRRLNGAEPIAITIVSRIEILRGWFDSILKAADGTQLMRAQHRLEVNEKYLHPLRVVTFNARAAAMFDDLCDDKKLRKIGRADLLIACIALAHLATLVTRNLKHFRLVPGLKVDNRAD